jgi:hypothetical protein
MIFDPRLGYRGEVTAMGIVLAARVRKDVRSLQAISTAVGICSFHTVLLYFIVVTRRRTDTEA